MATVRAAADAFSREANLKRQLRRHLKGLGFRKSSDGRLAPPDGGKDKVRTLHLQQRASVLAENQAFIADKLPNCVRYFANGEDVDPTKVKPLLQRVSSSTWEADLFRLASLSWSVPVSAGFGRRIRYLVWDGNNGKLIGIAAIGDPVYNLSVRDDFIGWDVSDRAKRLVNVMDAYVLGAVPPYNTLLGGKLVACLLRTRDVYDDFSSKYGGTSGLISKESKRAKLFAITTSSSMGRSSVYNRLKLEGTEYFRSIGFTSGWGHFHIPEDLFAEMREYLRTVEHAYADSHAFGQGPNWRLRTTKAALTALGLDPNLMKHGVQREVFVAQLASNASKLLTGEGQRANLRSLLSVEEVGALAVQRWVVGRSERRPEYRKWSRESFAALLSTSQTAEPAPGRGANALTK